MFIYQEQQALKLRTRLSDDPGQQGFREAALISQWIMITENKNTKKIPT